MIQKLQKLFHTDKWWGKVLFIICFNILFFISGIIVYPLFSWIENIKLLLPSGWFSFLYFYIILPILSCIFISKIWYKFNIKINKIALFFINISIIILIFLSFFLVAYFSIRPNFF